jgi:hemerythrin
MPHWKPDHRLDIASMDLQHEEMLRLVGDLYDSIAEGRGKAAMSAVLDRLIKYTGSHFDAEEELMLDCGYLDLAEHTAEHRKFTQRILELQREFRKHRRGLTLEVLCVLKDWLNDHMLLRDSQYGPVVRSRLAALDATPGSVQVPV